MQGENEVLARLKKESKNQKSNIKNNVFKSTRENRCYGKHSKSQEQNREKKQNGRLNTSNELTGSMNQPSDFQYEAYGQ